MCEEHRMTVQYNQVRFPNASDGHICPAVVILAKRKARLYKNPQNPLTKMDKYYIIKGQFDKTERFQRKPTN